MKNKHSLLLCSLLLCVGFFACNRVKDYIEPHTLLIFPTDPGHFRISLVQDTTYDTGGPVPAAYYKKEVNGGLETDLTGRTIQAIEIFRSPEELGQNYQFTLSRVWAQYIEPVEGQNYYAERIEENVRTLILKFPVYEGIRWNGNLYNNRGVQEYKYGNIDTTVVVRGRSFPNCVVVIQKADTSGFINKKFAYEIYSPEIGLVKKYDRSLVFDGPNGEFNPDKSRIYVEEIIENN
ncbi:MAG: hypothetical protein EAZ89_12870 [Bacteroidetes bacterium]|nr:MAG: hypothetical protein EAZ89_12870 [Bacteroidota bacterium]